MARRSRAGADGEGETRPDREGGRKRTSHDARQDLAVQLSELARDLQSERSTQEVLDEIVTAAVANVPGAAYAGISQVQSRRRVSTTAATADLVRQVDQAQYDTGEGPA